MITTRPTAGTPQSPELAEAACRALLAVEERRNQLIREMTRIERQVDRARRVVGTPLPLYPLLAVVSLGFAVWAFTLSTLPVRVIAAVALAVTVQQVAAALHVLLVRGPRWTTQVIDRVTQIGVELEQCRDDAVSLTHHG